MEIFPFELEGKVFFSNDQKRNDDADELGKYCGIGGSLGTHVEFTNEK